jgi:hypothetical protein
VSGFYLLCVTLELAPFGCGGHQGRFGEDFGDVRNEFLNAILLLVLLLRRLIITQVFI